MTMVVGAVFAMRSGVSHTAVALESSLPLFNLLPRDAMHHELSDILAWEWETVYDY
jgi:hypothetical protein